MSSTKGKSDGIDRNWQSFYGNRRNNKPVIELEEDNTNDDDEKNWNLSLNLERMIILKTRVKT